MGFLRAMFGPSRDEVWSRLAGQVGGRFEDRGFWGGGGRVQVDVGEWTVTLDTYTVSTGKHSTTYTRLRAPYVNRDGLRFSIRRRHLFDGIGRMLGLQDVEVGHRAFDDAFVIKATDESKVRRLFANADLRRLLEAQPDVLLEVRDDEGWFGAKFPDGVDELRFQAHGVIRDEARLRALFDLFAETLHTLCHVGSAYGDDPRLRL